MSNYRPKDWERIKSGVQDGFAYTDDSDIVRYPDMEVYEAGADAILEKLKDSGTFTYGHHSPDIDDQEISGYWVFIPDEE